MSLFLYLTLSHQDAFITHIFSPVLADAEKLQALALWLAASIAKKDQRQIHVAHANRAKT